MSEYSEKLAKIGMVIAEVINKAGEFGVPSGHVYAAVMSIMSLDDYNVVISALKKGGYVSESGYLLKWIPQKQTEKV
jgi:hypothetical protein